MPQPVGIIYVESLARYLKGFSLRLSPDIRQQLEDQFTATDTYRHRVIKPGEPSELAAAAALERAARRFDKFPQEGSTADDAVSFFREFRLQHDPAVLYGRFHHTYGELAQKETDPARRFIHLVAQQEAGAVADVLDHLSDYNYGGLLNIAGMTGDPDIYQAPLIHGAYSLFFVGGKTFKEDEFLQTIRGNSYLPAKWRSILQERLASMREMTQITTGERAEATHRSDGLPIETSLQWAASLYKTGVNPVTSFSDFPDRVMSSLAVLLRHGEYELFDAFIELRTHHFFNTKQEIACRSLLFAAAAAGIFDDETREDVLDAIEVIGADSFDSDTSLEKSVNDLILRLGWVGQQGERYDAVQEYLRRQRPVRGSPVETTFHEARIGRMVRETRRNRELAESGCRRVNYAALRRVARIPVRTAARI